MDYETLNSQGQDRFCSMVSLEEQESMVGTASVVTTWYLLEYTGQWLAKATQQNALPIEIQDWINEQLALAEQSRLVFIKQSKRTDQSKLSFFVARTREGESCLYHFSLASYQDLFGLNIPALLSGSTVYSGYLYAKPFYLVCTNGKRDRCCARFGLALYQALAEIVGHSVWQCTHLGGHRFAPTLVTFPDGSYYGRLSPVDMKDFVRSQENGEFYINNLRGRCCFSEVTQAAEYYLHQETGFYARDSFRHLSTEQLSEDLWSMDFQKSGEGDVHRLIVRQQQSDHPRLVSCSPQKTKPVLQFQLISHNKLIL